MKKNYIFIILAAIMWGCTGLYSRALYGAGLSPYNILTIRNCGSMLVLAAVFAVCDRSVFKVRLRDMPIFFCTGVVSVMLFTLCYFSCQRVCSLAVAGILLYTAPVFVMVTSALLGQEKITKRKLIALIMALAGCVLVSGIGGNEQVSARGILLGLGSGAFYAAYSIFGSFALKRHSSNTVTFMTFVFAGVGSLFFVNDGLAAVLSSPRTFLYCVGLVVTSTVLPYLLYTRGLSGTESGKASIIASFEPVTAAVMGALVFNEQFGITTALGMVGVLGGVILLTGKEK